MARHGRHRHLRRQRRGRILGRCHDRPAQDIPLLTSEIPSHVSLRGLFERLDPGRFRRRLLRRIEASHEVTVRQIIGMDGDRLRRPFDPAMGQASLHLGDSWETANHLLTGRVSVDKKSIAITAIPVPLRLPQLSGAIPTFDAKGRPKAVARLTRDEGSTAYSRLRQTTSIGVGR